MTDAEQAMKAAQAKHLARLTGPQTCCAKLGDPGPQGMRVCGAPVEYVKVGSAGATYSGWRHAIPDVDYGHLAVPASYSR